MNHGRKCQWRKCSITIRSIMKSWISIICNFLQNRLQCDFCIVDSVYLSRSKWFKSFWNSVISLSHLILVDDIIITVKDSFKILQKLINGSIRMQLDFGTNRTHFNHFNGHQATLGTWYAYSLKEKCELYENVNSVWCAERS